MWQSSGKFQPRKDQLERIAPVIINMGCFARVETNGGAFEQVNLLAGENPNTADLAGSAAIAPDHIREAISYRNLDRSSWGITIVPSTKR